MTSKVAVVTGITGQDGSYLAELLLSKDYEVHGLRRRSSTFNTSRIDHLYIDPLQSKSNFYLHYGDMSDSTSLIRMLSIARPSEIYNLGAQSQVAVSFETPEYTADSSGMGTLRLLEAMRTTDLSQNCKFYQASTSELFGGLSNEAYSEKSEFRPRSPYAVSKLFAYWTTVNYREAYNIWAVNGILFNHESPRRGETFVTRKITRGLSRIKHGLQERLVLGNLDAERDWGHAKDFVDAMWLMMQQEKPEDYVIATGEKHSVREFVNYTAAALEMKINWLGKGNDEHGVNDLGKTIISLDSGYERPTEVNQLLGDSSLARTKLGWSPRFKFEDLVLEMAEADEQLAIIEKSRR